MIKNNRFWTVCISVLVLIFFACSAGVKLRFQRPGQIEFAGIKRLAIAPSSGVVEAPDFQKALTEELEKTGFFELIYHDDYTEQFRDHHLTYYEIAESDSQALGQVGGWLNVDGMLFTELKTLEMEFQAEGMEKVEKKVWTGEYERNEFGEVLEKEEESGDKTKKKKIKVKILDQKFQIRKAKIEVFLRLVDFQMGTIIGSWNKVEHFVDNSIIGDPAAEELPTEEEIKQILMDKVVADFVAEVGPRIEFVRRGIETGVATVDSGAVFARNGQWREALNFWEKIEKLSPNNARVYYNLGLAYEAVGDYKAAEMNYLKASLLDIENKDYQKAMDNIQEIWLEKANRK